MNDNMKDQYFYINTESYADFPADNDENIRKVSFIDINILAYIAAELESYPSISEIDGKKQALKDYLIINKYQKLLESYKLLKLNINGERMLNVAIELFCFEKEFRENGIHYLDNLEKYNECIERRKMVIALNEKIFKEEYNKNK